MVSARALAGVSVSANAQAQRKLDVGAAGKELVCLRGATSSASHNASTEGKMSRMIGEIDRLFRMEDPRPFAQASLTCSTELSPYQ